MNDKALKKYMFIVLFITMAIIWIYNMYQLVPPSADKYVKTSNSYNKDIGIKSNKAVLNTENLIIDKIYSDPFQPYFVRTTAKVKKKVTRKIAPKIVPPFFRYKGFVQNGNSKHAIIEFVGGDTEIIRSQDELLEMKFTVINDDSIKFVFKGEKFSVKLGQ